MEFHLYLVFDKQPGKIDYTETLYRRQQLCVIWKFTILMVVFWIYIQIFQVIIYYLMNIRVNMSITILNPIVSKKNSIYLFSYCLFIALQICFMNRNHQNAFILVFSIHQLISKVWMLYLSISFTPLLISEVLKPLFQINSLAKIAISA